jgi:ADP-ribose pyrophosphatase
MSDSSSRIERIRLVDAREAGRIGKEKPGQLASGVIHTGAIVHLARDTVRFPDGSTGELELVRHSGASAVVALLGDPTDQDPEVVLLRQFRYAAGGELFEVPAGRPDRDGEPWEEVATRELEEETGYAAGKVEYLTTIYTTPGFTDERIHLFLATGLDKGTTNLDQDEFVEVVVLPLSRALEFVRDGTIIDAKSVTALLYFSAFRSRI